jgi:serine/threonine-protein kinase
MLVDFGIAKLYDPHLVTTVGAKAVTPGFSPPEQYGGATDPRSDIYALGATLYTLLTGQKMPESITRMTTSVPLTPPHLLNSAISPAVEHAILRSTEVATDRRFQSVQELVRRVDSGQWTVAFSMHPVAIEDVMAYSDAGLIMPPKSTWFEPKLRDAMFCHLIGPRS